MQRIVGIVCNGLGNITSIMRMLNRVGARATYVTKEADFTQVDSLILPGVGHFDEGMRSLRHRKLISPLIDLIRNKKVPTLGICLGMQLLCRNSEEGTERGLGLIDADVKKFKFPAGMRFKVPHMGWNVVHAAAHNALIDPNQQEQRFYFVHSYKVVPDNQNIVIGTCTHYDNFCAAFQKENIFGVQFHPEKSHSFGMALLKNFTELSIC